MTDPRDKNGGDRDQKGRFQPGNPGGPGNPHIRRLSEYQVAVREAITPEMLSVLLRRLLKAALEGDVNAARVVLDRVMGRPSNAPESSESMPIKLPSVSSARDTVTAANEVLAALSGGRITTEEATRVIGIVETVRRCIETADLDARLARLEMRLKDERENPLFLANHEHGSV